MAHRVSTAGDSLAATPAVQPVQRSRRRSVRRLLGRVFRVVAAGVIFFMAIGAVPASAVTPDGYYETRLGAISGPQSFSLSLWTVQAVRQKLEENLGRKPWAGMTPEQQKAAFDDFFSSAGKQDELEGKVRDLSSRGVAANDPQLLDLESQLAAVRQKRAQESALVERTLEDQVQGVLKQENIALFREGGIFLPPVFSKLIDLPQVLVISNRDKIEMRSQVALQRAITLANTEKLESSVDKDLNVSSLVVPIGGYSTYPTMIAGTGPRDWIVGVVAHEWCHIYLAFHPLGQAYGKSGEVTAMNETVCTIFGDDISATVLEQDYGIPKPTPSWATPPAPAGQQPQDTQPQGDQAQAFNANRELGKIYQAAEERLKAGDVAGAEQVMADGQKLLADHDVYIRKLNQAFFAFYGSYAEGPNSIRPDPVGADLRELRRRSPTLKDFFETVAKMASYDDLKRALGK